MRNPLDAVKSQRDMWFDGGNKNDSDDNGGNNTQTSVLGPMSTNESVGSDKSDVENLSGLANDSDISAWRNLNPPAGVNGQSQGMRTLPLQNGDAVNGQNTSNAVFNNHTLKETDPVI